MPLLLLERKVEKVMPLRDYYRNIYDAIFDVKTEETMPYQIINDYLKPLIYQDIVLKDICIPCSKSVIDDTISRNATWKALFEDKPIPAVEEKAVTKYAGSLDKYLPENVPVDEVLKHAKG
jgi:hypothetical protein